MFDIEKLVNDIETITKSLDFSKHITIAKNQGIPEISKQLKEIREKTASLKKINEVFDLFDLVLSAQLTSLDKYLNAFTLQKQIRQKIVIFLTDIKNMDSNERIIVQKHIEDKITTLIEKQSTPEEIQLKNKEELSFEIIDIWRSLQNTFKIESEKDSYDTITTGIKKPKKQISWKVSVDENLKEYEITPEGNYSSDMIITQLKNPNSLLTETLSPPTLEIPPNTAKNEDIFDVIFNENFNTSQEASAAPRHNKL